ncbi:MAG: acyltransferase [Chitinophagaceae bacterium]|nr:acyltransferase [Chitinophagaceae bacterium]
MSPVSLLPILPIILIALATMKLTGAILGIKPAEGRFASIDGLRGYMAFFVFLHHSCIWYLAMHGYGWRPPPSNLYSQFGSTSVAVFFMITSFLFFSRLLQARKGDMDWLKLYVSRGFRIMPLYLFALLIVLIIVAILSHFTLHEPTGKVIVEIFQWLAFIKADINGISPTWLIIAGVIWSLPYEWLFYFALPLLGLLLSMRISFLVWVFAMAGFFFFFYVILTFYTSGGILNHLLPFLSGIAAAFLVKIPQVRALASGPAASVCIALCLIAGVGWFKSLDEVAPFLLVSVSFVGIACGNSLFGILTHSLSRTLGQISYSIYLLHGIVLFVTFNWILGFQRAAQFSPLLHWGIIAVCAVGVVTICSLTYYFIERPGMDAASAATKKLRKQVRAPGILKNA